MNNSELINYILDSNDFVGKVEVSTVDIIGTLKDTVIEKKFIEKLLKDTYHDFYFMLNGRCCFTKIQEEKE